MSVLIDIGRTCVIELVEVGQKISTCVRAGSVVYNWGRGNLVDIDVESVEDECGS